MVGWLLVLCALSDNHRDPQRAQRSTDGSGSVTETSIPPLWISVSSVVIAYFKRLSLAWTPGSRPFSSQVESRRPC